MNLDYILNKYTDQITQMVVDYCHDREMQHPMIKQVILNYVKFVLDEGSNLVKNQAFKAPYKDQFKITNNQTIIEEGK